MLLGDQNGKTSSRLAVQGIQMPSASSVILAMHQQDLYHMLCMLWRSVFDLAGVEEEFEDEDRRHQRRRRANESGIGTRSYPSSQPASQLGNDARGQYYKTATFAQPS